MWDLLERYLDRLDDLRRFLSIADSIERYGAVQWKQAKREARSSTIVCSMAELEALVVGTLGFVNEQINLSETAIGLLRPSLRPLAAYRELTSLAALSDADKMWKQRAFVTCLESSQVVAALPVFAGRVAREPQPPLDGRTMKPHHLQRIGGVYGIAVGSFIQTHQTLSLKKLSDARNDIAHGNVPFNSMFARAGFQPDDIRSDLASFDDIGYGIVVAFDEYLRLRGYLAQP